MDASVFLIKLSNIMIHSSSCDHNESRWSMYESSSSLVLMGVTMVVEEVVWSELTVVLEPTVALELTVSIELVDRSELMEVVEVLDRDLSILDGVDGWLGCRS